MSNRHRLLLTLGFIYTSLILILSGCIPTSSPNDPYTDGLTETTLHLTPDVSTTPSATYTLVPTIEQEPSATATLTEGIGGGGVEITDRVSFYKGVYAACLWEKIGDEPSVPFYVITDCMDRVANFAMVPGWENRPLPGWDPLNDPTPTRRPSSTSTPTNLPEATFTRTPVPATAQYYVVQKGDTFSGIALKAHLSVAQLRALNLTILNPSLISIGQRIRIK